MVFMLYVFSHNKSKDRERLIFLAHSPFLATLSREAAKRYQGAFSFDDFVLKS